MLRLLEIYHRFHLLPSFPGLYMLRLPDIYHNTAKPPIVSSYRGFLFSIPFFARCFNPLADCRLSSLIRSFFNINKLSKIYLIFYNYSFISVAIASISITIPLLNFPTCIVLLAGGLSGKYSL